MSNGIVVSPNKIQYPRIFSFPSLLTPEKIINPQKGFKEINIIRKKKLRILSKGAQENAQKIHFRAE